MPNFDRIAIVGTAPSWTRTPWTDSGLHIASLNDAYRMRGFVRADSWWDFHPMDRFWFKPVDQTHVYAHQVPPGYYVRPEGHLEWLAKQSIPVYLHEQYKTQYPAAANWPHARPIPRTEIEAYYGRYFTSSPAVMMAWAAMQGVKELHIYGIHLATEHEYIEQRPNFEFIAGRILGRGKLTESVAHGIRRYETPDGVIFLPEDSPILQSDFRYAIDVRPRAALEPIKWDAHRVQIKRERVVNQLKRAKWWTRTKPLRDELWYLDAWAQDIQEQMARVGA